MGWLGQERHEREFAAETDRLAVLASGLDPGRPVPTCPEWTVRDLVTHVGRGHRTATTIVRDRLGSVPGLSVPGFNTDDAPEDPTAWPEWLTTGASALAGAIGDVGAGTEVFTWQRDRTAGFWLRRMLHDELIHRFDVELTVGEAGAVAGDLAAEGVSDLLETALTLSRYPQNPTPFVDLAGAGERLRFAAVDHPAVWIVERTPDGVTWRDGDGDAAVSVTAPARELLLLLNRRIGADHDGIGVTGDRGLLDHWLEHTRF